MEHSRSPLSIWKKANTSLPAPLLLTALLVSAMAAGCDRQKVLSPAANAPPPAVLVKLQRIQPTEVLDFDDYAGQLQVKERVTLVPQTKGRIQQIYVKQGQSVKTGTPILLLSQEKTQADLEAVQGQVFVLEGNRASAQTKLTQAEAELARQQVDVTAKETDVQTADIAIKSAEAEIQNRNNDLKLAQTNYNRTKDLVSQGALAELVLQRRTTELNDVRTALDNAIAAKNRAISNKKIAQQNLVASQKAQDLAQANAKSAQAALAQAQTALSQAQGNVKSASTGLNYKKIVAPIDGVVGNIPVKVGEEVKSGQELTSLVQNDAFDLQIPISIQRTPQVKIGTPVQLINPQNNQLLVTGSINSIYPQTVPGAQSILAKARFPNTNGLQDGQTVRARIVWNKSPGILIPTTAITRIGSQPFVFVAQQDTTLGQPQMVVAQRPVQLGNVQGDNYHVKEGVQLGDSIAVSNILRLKDGTPIEPELSP